MFDLLIIDDCQGDRTIMSRMLEKHAPGHYKIEPISNFSDAAIRLQSPFDACLLDQSLGGATGLDLLRSIEGNSLHGPVIMVTGIASRWLDQSALEAGVFDFLSKDDLSPALLDKSIRYARRNFEKDIEVKDAKRLDQLTKAYNRLYFSELCDHAIDELNLCDRVDNLSLVYIDVDNFKAINNEFGNSAGNRVLKIIAQRIQNRIRANEVLARVGNDEFALYIPNSSQERVNTAIERLRETIAEPIDIGGSKTVNISASLGISRFPEQAETVDELFKLASMEVYLEKKAHKASRGVASSLNNVSSIRMKPA